MNEIECAITNLEEFLEADIGQGDLHMCSAEAALAALREKRDRGNMVPTCCGYRIEELVAFAKEMRENNITPETLHDAAGLVQRGFDAAEKLWMDALDTEFEKMCGRKLSKEAADV